ncbi:lysophospholipid acyltransferase family protein [uncultured Mailhella sp.]|uniref:lysophospholipid acyltransferase family protein n=1 Tax=uncultured Mailhella sp. TaxID=1981031 RepID=UPI002619C79D|nr:lysophospholipid acyltransferase family protein [uncultured Mailhella sp.]
MHLPPSVNSALLTGIYSAICATLRIREENRKVVDEYHAQGRRLIFCLWHDELFSLIPVSRQLKVVAIVSPSSDGAVLTRILASKNVGAVHGSSTRGGVRALLTLAHMMKKELIHACITLDGPLGPRHKAKEGALFLANRTGAHILPVRIFVKHHFHLPTWDKFQVPLPFSKVVIRFGTPWGNGGEEIPNIETPTLERAKVRLEDELHRLGQDLIPGEKA